MSSIGLIAPQDENLSTNPADVRVVLDTSTSLAVLPATLEEEAAVRSCLADTGPSDPALARTHIFTLQGATTGPFRVVGNPMTVFTDDHQIQSISLSPSDAVDVSTPFSGSLIGRYRAGPSNQATTCSWSDAASSPLV